MLITDAITPVLQRLHPDGKGASHFCKYQRHSYGSGNPRGNSIILVDSRFHGNDRPTDCRDETFANSGCTRRQLLHWQDAGIYWRLTEPPQRWAIAPAWFYVPQVPPTLEGQLRRSYVLWQEIVAPLIVLEFMLGDGAEARDRTPYSGKFWVYEQAICVPFYGIYEVRRASVEVYHLVENRYHPLPANERSHVPIPPLGMTLGIWQGRYKNATLPWLRWWDDQGNLLLTAEEQAEREQQRADQAEAMTGIFRFQGERLNFVWQMPQPPIVAFCAGSTSIP